MVCLNLELQASSKMCILSRNLQDFFGSKHISVQDDFLWP